MRRSPYAFSLQEYRTALREQITQCLRICSPFVDGATAGVCDALLYSLIRYARTINVCGHADLDAYVTQFEAIPNVAKALAARAPMSVHAPFVRLNCVY